MSKKRSSSAKIRHPRAEKRKKNKTRANGNDSLRQIKIPEELPLLPAKDLVAFPSVTMSLHVGRPSSINAVEASLDSDQLILIVTQKSEQVENPSSEDLYHIGVVAHVVKTLKLPEERFKVLVQGVVRAKIVSIDEKGEFLKAKIKPLPPPEKTKLRAADEAIMNRIRENLQVLVEREHLPEEMLVVTEDVTDPGVLADLIVAHFRLSPSQAQEILEELDPRKRLRLTDIMLTNDLNQFLISEQIRDQARNELTKGQKEYYLREQIRQIQRELGEQEGSVEDLTQLKEALEKAKLPDYAHKEAFKQFNRLERMSPESSEYALLRTYLDWVADLPWSEATKDKLDLRQAKKVLDRDHFGLAKAKDRILEYLAVRKLNPDSRGAILCFVGPPGVGKTSLGRSIANSLGRKFFRLSLGGVRDEAEIRGHRRTYVGALPGRIIQGLKQTGSKNPVFVLDELDKVGMDFRGDPASALLEVLDPAQNKEFADHYLNMPFDLSEIIFVATANTLDTIPEALLDRLELIFISGYTALEKESIAKRFLIPRQIKENGLEKIKFKITDESLKYLIERYTSEAGVRNLEREIGSLLRKIAREYTHSGKYPSSVTPETIRKLLGNTKYDPEARENRSAIGVVQGLAWTVHGGEIMPIEASIAKGKGQLSLTGQLGNIMQESAQAALFYARSNAEILGLDPEFHEQYDMHLHIPNGATPKDGPSAGITIATALVSALSQRRVSKDIAMTGEITLRGNILPIGGLKEKALAALRYGIKKIIIPFENMKDTEEIPKEQREKIKFVPVKHISEVLEIALMDLPLRKKGAFRNKKKNVKPAITAEA